MPVSKEKMQLLRDRDCEMDRLEAAGFDFQSFQKNLDEMSGDELANELKRRKEEMIELDKQGFKFDEFESYLPEANTDPELAFHYLTRDLILELKQLRLANGFTQDDVATEMGIKQEDVLNFENYENPSLEFAFRYAYVLGKKLIITIQGR